MVKVFGIFDGRMKIDSEPNHNNKDSKIICIYCGVNNTEIVNIGTKEQGLIAKKIHCFNCGMVY